MPGKIVVRGARVHNLKSISLEIPRDQLVVITGVSGSGKSSLAFDTLYAEGQRRYLESLSVNARQFLQKMKKPDVDSIEGLSPAISIEQKQPIFSRRSTVGTVTEIYDFLRLLFARIGQPTCIRCGREIMAQTTQQIVDQLLLLPTGTRIFLMAPIVPGSRVNQQELVRDLAAEGFARVRIDGQIRELADEIKIDKNQARQIDLIVDRLVLRDGISRRLADSLEVASRYGRGVIRVEIFPGERSGPSGEMTFSQKFACLLCGDSFPEVTPSLFSFNSPHGACPVCGGLGTESLNRVGSRGAQDTSSTSLCKECRGARLRKESLAVKLGGKSIADLATMSMIDALGFFDRLRLDDKQLAVAQSIVKEISSRLQFLVKAGLDYLTLNRASATLSGGEAQRVRLATQLGSELSGVLYILDEPSVGLHQKDNAQLLALMKELRDSGNSVIVVEHDRETILEADHVIDMGPGAGIHGGQVIAQGRPEEIEHDARSLTGSYLSGRREIVVPARRRRGSRDALVIRGARQNNLKNVTVEMPVGAITCVTGVSGSGKSSLVMDILYREMSRRLRRAQGPVGLFDEMLGWEHFSRVIGVDQVPIGRTPHSNPATYTGLYDPLRNLFAQLPEARVRGYKAARFSFNAIGGRCEACKGDGIVRVEMYFLPEVLVTCEVCKGRRYNRETLEVKYKGFSIADVLDLTANEALQIFSNVPALENKLRALVEVGLGYLHLGQVAPTLSGGEAQRIKLARELVRRSTGRSLYILDEPTTGLHFDDIKKLIELLNRLIELGNTIVLIEHNLDVIKSADYIIDLGPGGADKGGKVIASGTPEDIARSQVSFTGQYLRKMLATAAGEVAARPSGTYLS